MTSFVAGQHTARSERDMTHTRRESASTAPGEPPERLVPTEVPERLVPAEPPERLVPAEPSPGPGAPSQPSAPQIGRHTAPAAA